MSAIRVLVVEDSATARLLLVDILESDPGIEVVGETDDGAAVLGLVKSLSPDLVITGLHTPTMSALELTRQIMADRPTPVVIVTASTSPEQFALATGALQAGALTVVPRPVSPSAASCDLSWRDLLRTVKAMAQVKLVRSRPPSRAPGPASQDLSPQPAQTQVPRLIAIATSTGGPPSLQTVLRQLGTRLPCPVLILQHLTPGFVEGMATWLTSTTGARVSVARAGVVPQAGEFYIAPDHEHLEIDSQGRLALSTAPPVGGFRPSADVLFHSVARQFGAAAIGVILTGMGRDGVAGLTTLRGAGGLVIAQDEASCVVYGMSKETADAGLAHAVLSLEDIGHHLLRYCDRSRR